MKAVRLNLITISAFVVLLTTFLFLVSSQAQAAFNGAYTIDAKSPASKTNYQTIGDIISDLRHGNRHDGFNANGPGLNGSVVITIVKGSGPYSERVLIDSIPGASETNHIIFNGNGEMLDYKQYVDPKFGVWQFVGATYFTLKNLTINVLHDSGGTNLQIANKSHHVNIRNCTFSQPNNVGAFVGSCYLQLTNTAGYGVPGEYILISNNTFTGNGTSAAENGIYSEYAALDSVDRHVTVSYNSIRDFSRRGIYFKSGVNHQIVGNELSYNYGLSSLLKVIHTEEWGNAFGMRVDSNYIHDIRISPGDFRAIHIDASGTKGTLDMSVQHNKVVLDSAVGTVTGIYVDNSYCYGKVKLAIRFNQVKINRSHAVLTQSVGIYNNSRLVKTYISDEMVGNSVEITGNSNNYGIIHNGDGELTNTPTLVANNIVSTNALGDGYPIFITGTSSKIYQVYHNTLSAIEDEQVQKSTNKVLLNVENGIYDIQNNIFYGEVSVGKLIGIQFDNNEGLTIDYNAFFLKKNGQGTSKFVFGLPSKPGNNWANFEHFVSGGNDINTYPMFNNLSGFNLTPTNKFIWNKGTPLPNVKLDVNGEVRSSSTPDMGAIETNEFNGIQENNFSKNLPFQIYPNPAKTEITIARKEVKEICEIQVYSSTGQLLRSHIFSKNQDYLVINLTGLNSGIYLVNVQNGTNNYNHKLLIN